LLAVLHVRGAHDKTARRSQRFAVSLPASLRMTNTGGSVWEKVVLDNLSLGGARVRALTPLQLRSKVDVTIDLGEGREVELRGVVVYARKSKTGFASEYGVRFVELTYDRYRELIRYINDREAALKAGLDQPAQSQPA
jgi:hypothetical protein